MGELKQHQPPMTIDEQEEKYNDKSIIHLPRQAKVRQFMSEVVGWCGVNRCKPSHSLLPFDYG